MSSLTFINSVYLKSISQQRQFAADLQRNHHPPPTSIVETDFSGEKCLLNSAYFISRDYYRRKRGEGANGRHKDHLDGQLTNSAACLSNF